VFRYCAEITRSDQPPIQRAGWIRVAAGAAVCLSLAASGRAAPPADSGTFQLTIQETPIGTDTFSADPDGSSDGTFTVTIGGKPMSLHVITKMTAGGLSQVSADAGPLGAYKATLAGPRSAVTMRVGGKSTTATEALPAAVFPFSSFAPHLLSPLVAAYDHAKGGRQTFQIVAVDGLGAGGKLIVLPTTLTEVGSPESRTIAGQPLRLFRYAISLPSAVGPMDLQATADDRNRILLWNVPGQKYLAVREGYADLLRPAAPTAASALAPPSPATYGVRTETGVRVRMRDGVPLAVTIYRPDAPGKFPVILERTPYNRQNSFQGTFYARRGYAYVVQDVRGKFDSGGTWTPFVNEAKDGADTIDWCAAQPWSTGDVGMIGASYEAYAEWMAAREKNPHLKCLIPEVSPSDPFFNIPYAYGAVFLYPSLWWAAIVEGNKMQTPRNLPDFKAFSTLPLRNVDRALFGHHIPFVQQWLSHSSNDGYWQQASFEPQIAELPPLPVLHISGWFDGDGIGTKRNYAAMIAAGQRNQKLIYGPWGHALDATTRLGDHDFGAGSYRDLDTICLRWFDRWLKGVANGIDQEPPVDAFLMGSNVWQPYPAWPPPTAQMQRWYLHSSGHANGSSGDGTIAAVAAIHEAADHYTYDPAHPLIPASLQNYVKTGVLSTDESTDARRPDVLAYTSAPLAKDLAVAGPISFHVAAKTSGKDTDWIVSLLDVGPDGKPFGLCTGVIRARFRNSFSKPVLLSPGEIADYTIDLWATGNVFLRGHRIRVEVTSSMFPIYDRNLNTGEDIATGTRMIIAHQTVLHDSGHESYVTLPVVSIQPAPTATASEAQ
jgi:hypothetical protein